MNTPFGKGLARMLKLKFGISEQIFFAMAANLHEMGAWLDLNAAKGYSFAAFDAAKFDSSLSHSLLEAAINIYALYGMPKKMVKRLIKAIRTVGRGRWWRYIVEAGRRSGEWDTSVGNNLIMACILAHVLTLMGMDFRIMLAGDDSIIAYKGEFDRERFMYLVGTLWGVELEDSGNSGSRVDFCSKCFVPTDKGLVASYIPTRVMKSFIQDYSVNPKMIAARYKEHCTGVALGLMTENVHPIVIALCEFHTGNKYEYDLLALEWCCTRYNLTMAELLRLLHRYSTGTYTQSDVDYIALGDGYGARDEVTDFDVEAALATFYNAGCDDELSEEYVKRISPEYLYAYIDYETRLMRLAGVPEEVIDIIAQLHVKWTNLDIEEGYWRHKLYNQGTYQARSRKHKRDAEVKKNEAKLTRAERRAQRREQPKKKKKSFMAELGRKAGTVVGGAPGGVIGEYVGDNLGSALGALVGSGDYRSGGRKLAGNLPHMASERVTKTVSATEMIAEVTTGTSACSVTTFPLQPGILAPIMAAESTDYIHYRIKAMVFDYKPESAAVFNSTNGSMGYVAMAVQYDPSEAAYTTKQEFSSSQFSSIGAPHLEMATPVECKESYQAYKWYKIRYGAPANDSINTYDYGVLNVAVGEAQAAYTSGSIYVTWTIEYSVRDPLYAADVPIQHTYRLQATSGISTSAYLGSSATQTIVGSMNASTPGATGVALHDITIGTGIYYDYTVIGDSTACTAPTVTISGGVFNTSTTYPYGFLGIGSTTTTRTAAVGGNTPAGTTTTMCVARGFATCTNAVGLFTIVLSSGTLPANATQVVLNITTWPAPGIGAPQRIPIKVARVGPRPDKVVFRDLLEVLRPPLTYIQRFSSFFYDYRTSLGELPTEDIARRWLVEVGALATDESPFVLGANHVTLQEEKCDCVDSHDCEVFVRPAPICTRRFM
jgi:hypothetical protein